MPSAAARSRSNSARPHNRSSKSSRNSSANRPPATRPKPIANRPKHASNSSNKPLQLPPSKNARPPLLPQPNRSARPMQPQQPVPEPKPPITRRSWHACRHKPVAAVADRPRPGARKAVARLPAAKGARQPAMPPRYAPAFARISSIPITMATTRAPMWKSAPRLMAPSPAGVSSAPAATRPGTRPCYALSTKPAPFPRMWMAACRG